MAVIRVLLVDDNAIVRRGIASLLAEADGIEVVGEAGDGREAIAVARELRPDVVCLDVRMPVMDGVAAAKPLSERAKVLMLSYSEDEPLVTGAISNGASGYLVHGRFEPDELEAASGPSRAARWCSRPAVTPAVFDALRRAPGPANDEREEGLGSLTAREREVLNLLARGLSNRDIAEELVITNKTVKNHLSRIYEKIGVHSRAEAIALWLGVGGQLNAPGGPMRNWDPWSPAKLSPAASRRSRRARNGDRSQSVTHSSGGTAACRTSPPHAGRFRELCIRAHGARLSDPQPRRRRARPDRRRVHGHPARRRVIIAALFAVAHRHPDRQRGRRHGRQDRGRRRQVARLRNLRDIRPASRPGACAQAPGRFGIRAASRILDAGADRRADQGGRQHGHEGRRPRSGRRAAAGPLRAAEGREGGRRR